MGNRTLFSKLSFIGLLISACRSQTSHQEFAALKQSNAEANHREEVLKKLASAHDSYIEISSNIKEGTKVNHKNILLMTVIMHITSLHYDQHFSYACLNKGKSGKSYQVTINVEHSSIISGHIVIYPLVSSGRHI